SHHEEADYPCSVRSRKPVGQIKYDAGKESRLSDTQKKSHDVERDRSRDEAHCRGNQSPAQHQESDPSPSADAFQDQIARHLKQKIADKEDACTPAVGCG